MNEGLRSGVAQTLPMLSKELLLGYDSLEELLEKMATINLVQRVIGHSWVMIRSPEHVHAIELYRLFVFDPAKPPNRTHCEGINAWLARLEKHNEKTANVSLHTLFNEATITR